VNGPSGCFTLTSRDRFAQWEMRGPGWHRTAAPAHNNVRARFDVENVGNMETRRWWSGNVIE
jgi:hypothetical protein